MSTTLRPLINKIAFLLVLIPIFFGCTSVNTSKIDNLHKGKILKLGHAGLGFKSFVNPFNPYPPNGITALQKAMEYGADGIEVDVQMTKDSVLVLFHDMQLDESTNLEGCIPEKNWAEVELGEYKLGAFFDAFQSDKILRLDSVLSWFQSFNKYPFIHFDTRIYNTCNNQNPYVYSGKMAPVLLRKLEEYKVPSDKVLIISTTIEFLEYMQNLKSAYLLSYEETGDFEAGLNKVEKLRITSMTIKPKLITAEKVAFAHRKGIEIVTFGGKSRNGTGKLIKLNPDVIHSNNIRALVDLLEK